MKKAVILLPTYNEKDNLEKFIKEIFLREIDTPGWKFEILIVDSNSPDGTYQLAQKLAAKDKRIHPLLVGPGLGVALVEGHQYSIKNLKPEALVQLDADGQVGSEVLPRLLKGIDEGYNFVIGSRFAKGGGNNLPLMRKIFTWVSCWYCKIVMGPFDIMEFTNSARAFTPELFKKIKINRIPYKEKTFIIQPAFLNEAVIAGAKYKEVPLIFKNREEGYSKNKTFNYTYDVLTYAIDARLHKLGFSFNFYHWARRGKTFIKFGLVGVTGTIVDFTFYKVFINLLAIAPATSKGFSTEIAIVNNFLLNNYWTFGARKTKNSLWRKFVIFNLVSFGGLLISVLVIKLLHSIYGDGAVDIAGLKIAYNNFYFFATIPPGMAWNFTVNHFITFKRVKEEEASVI